LSQARLAQIKLMSWTYDLVSALSECYNWWSEGSSNLIARKRQRRSMQKKEIQKNYIFQRRPERM